MFENSAGGFRFSTSVESKATGRHGHLRVVDDPIKPLETTGAREAGGAKLDAVIDWWSNTMSTRVTDPSCPRYMVIMQRLHERDLAGWLTSVDRPASERPLHVVFPMRFDPRRRFVSPDDELVDPRRTAGELFWPGRFPEPAVKSLELALGTHASAQLDQDPVPPKGHLFSSDEQRYYEDEPEVLARRADRQILSADCTFKESTGSDYVAIQVWAELREDRYVRGLGTIGVWYALLDEVWRRMGFVDTLAEVERLVRKWPGIGAKLVEDKANGSAVIDVLRRKIPGLIEVQPNGGKVARANAVQYLYRAGNVFYPTSEHAPWIVDHTAELIKFPRGRNDDRVDAETQALSYLAGQPMGILDAMGLLA
jgi:predicted phage terminase large subunit-like protein